MELDKFLGVVEVSAHCDVPCGIYDPHDAIQAARTVIRMTELIEETAADGSRDAIHKIARYTMVKEQHAAKAKNDILVIWTDYFKPPHLERFPNLHEKVWNACKLGSFVKQNISLEKAREFKSALEEIGAIFDKTKS